MLGFELSLYYPVPILHHYLLQSPKSIVNFPILIVHLDNLDLNSHSTLRFLAPIHEVYHTLYYILFSATSGLHLHFPVIRIMIIS